MTSRRPDLSQYPTGFTVLRIFQAVLNIITIVVTSFTINAVFIRGICFLIITVRKKLFRSSLEMVCCFCLQTSASLLFSTWLAFAYFFPNRLFNYLVAAI